MRSDVLCTKFGTAKVNLNGYYTITSSKEGNHNKLLHRLIFEDFYGIDLIEEFPNGIHIHHVDKNKKNNNIWNLEPVPPFEHLSYHSKQKHSDEHNLKISQSSNTSGLYRVSKNKNKQLKQGFLWRYTYYENGKQKAIVSTKLDELKKKVLKKGLIWKRITR